MPQPGHRRVQWICRGARRMCTCDEDMRLAWGRQASALTATELPNSPNQIFGGNGEKRRKTEKKGGLPPLVGNTPGRALGRRQVRLRDGTSVLKFLQYLLAVCQMSPKTV